LGALPIFSQAKPTRQVGMFIEKSLRNVDATTAGVVWRYQKLPIAGDSLSSYTKVEAGQNARMTA
jgi:hypothetical protein